MNISLWRSGLKTWMSQYVSVDSWDLRNPTDYNSTNGFIAPLQSIVFVNAETDYCQANQDIYITSRLRGDAKYHELDIGQLEQLYTMISERLVLAFGDIAPLRSLEMLAVPECINIQEYGDDMGDWLVTLMFSVNITWVPSNTPLPGDPATPVVDILRISTDLYREKISSTDHLNPTNRDKYGQMVISNL